MIAQILDIVDPDSKITNFVIEGTVKYVTLTKNSENKVCPLCGSKLYSKGKFQRHPNNQVLQDGYTLDLTLIGRRWKCSNPDCDYTCSDQFAFVQKRKRTTNIIIYNILFEFKDINLSCKQIAKKYHVSDTYTHQLFMKYIDLPRKELTPYICIDEVYLNLGNECKYALVIMDFITGEILDIIESRRKSTTHAYFMSIPLNERKKVLYLCCDMYDPYINYTSTYFPNAKAVTDSFHVLQWLINLINQYINKVKKRYQDKDKELLNDKNYKTNRDNKSIKESKEVYILKKAKWVLLSNPKNWVYHSSHYVDKLGKIMDTYSWEDEFLKLDDNFRTIRNLKDLYEDFNESFINDLDGAANRLDELIKIYENSDIYIFRRFAELLIEYHDSIINSFVYINDTNNKNKKEMLRRLSNGPLESFNNIPSALRAQSHGVTNFRYTRNRILWHLRENAAIKGVPYSDDEVHTVGRKRGKYNK